MGLCKYYGTMRFKDPTDADLLSDWTVPHWQVATFIESCILITTENQ